MKPLLVMLVLLFSFVAFGQTKSDSTALSKAQMNFNIAVQKVQNLKTELNQAKINAYDAWEKLSMQADAFRQKALADTTKKQK